ncbi:Auxilin-related protein 1 [Hibiscus syriacus]|uniref:Auxilin-related protein 1 n=1 Tax=Hibiscus syriacus TaxID=106335 RepID=A0A6A2XXI0_HIBSY|nr:auxilin-related protein 2-like [Hibiscus syriacus]XP_039045397.1 auxilin-related protein 2-like [Hibiscus syriacus]KAE8663259.1 Auxilin-related protein 1 [Hibiscus syriacus]
MDDFSGLFAKDFGIKPQGKSAPMAPPRNPSSDPNYGYRSDHTRSSSVKAKSSSNPIFDEQDRDGLSFNDVYGGPPKYSSESRATTAQTSSFDYDSFFKEPKPPVYDKPVYDDDLFDRLPGIKSSSTTSAAKFDDVFSISGSPTHHKHKSASSSPFDDLLGNLGRKETETKVNSERVKAEKDAPLFDDLLPGFGRSSSPAPARSTSEAGQSQNPPSNSTKTGSNLMEDPFVVFGSTSDPADLSSGLFTDPTEVISKPNGSGKTRVESSSGSGVVFDDLDPLDSIGKFVPFVSSDVNKRGKDRSPLRTSSGPQTSASKEPNDEEFEHYTKKRMPSMGNFPASQQAVFDKPSMSTDFRSSGGRATSPPANSNAGSNDTSSQVNTTPRYENFDTFDDLWLTVSEIPLFTQPTSAPPPSRPPPPRPPRASKQMSGSSSTNAKKKVNEFSSFPNSTQYSHSSKSAYTAASSNVTSQIDELEDFAMGKAQNNFDQAEVFPGDDFETSSVAAASAAAMKEAMDRAEAKFRHAKEMRERENLKAARNKEAGQMDKDERATHDALDREVREKQERLERERQQREIEEEEREKRRRELEREKEEEEREQRRLEKEREGVRQMEREKERVRQAVERATREAHERAAVEARARAERAAVEKAASEARQRAERAAVQRAQAEARERAASEARERAERAAAEAKEREAREKNAAAKAEAEARHRAAAEARERAAASARASQQKNEDDLESFFMGSRPSSAPRPRANTSDPLFDGQNKGGPEVASSMRKASSTANIVDDLSSIFGAAASLSGEFQEVDGETEERRRARLERHQRTQERAAKALAEKNQRDLQVQREQAERHRIAETLDVEIKRWAAGKEGNLRALLSTLQYVLWPECGWQPVSLTDLITAAAVKKVYRKATLCIHPDKVQQKGANLQQKYVAEKVFDLLKEAWNKFNSEELF